MDEETPDKKCAICGREGALAIFGVLMGLTIVAMSVDVIRKLVQEQTVNEMVTDD